MRKLSLLALAAALFTASCNNSDDDDVNVTPQPTSPYYFNFKLDGQQINLTADDPQYISSSPFEVGGYQHSESDFFQDMQLSFFFNHQPTNAEVLALAGKTFRFNDTGIRPTLVYSPSFQGNTQYSLDSVSAPYGVTVSAISFVKTDTTVFNDVDVYQVTGTCSAILEGQQSTDPTQTVSDGTFNFLISRVRE